jgi:hypothetical protein
MPDNGDGAGDGDGVFRLTCASCGRAHETPALLTGSALARVSQGRVPDCLAEDCSAGVGGGAKASRLFARLKAAYEETPLLREAERARDALRRAYPTGGGARGKMPQWAFACTQSAREADDVRDRLYAEHVAARALAARAATAAEADAAAALVADVQRAWNAVPTESECSVAVRLHLYERRARAAARSGDAEAADVLAALDDEIARVRARCAGRACNADARRQYCDNRAYGACPYTHDWADGVAWNDGDAVP